MKRFHVLLLLLLVAAAPAWAQSYGIGARVGVGTDLSDGFDSGNIDDRVLEVQGMVETEHGVLVRLRLGRFELEEDGEPSVDVERVSVDVEYQFRKDYYNAGLFLGAGYYETSLKNDVPPSWDDGDGHFGYLIGINGWFELSPDFYLVPEFSVERFENKESRTLGMLTLAAVYRF